MAAVLAQFTGPLGKILAAIVNAIDKFGWYEINKLRELAQRIEDMNGPDGVAIGGGWNTGNSSLLVLNRATGDVREVKLGYLLYRRIVPAEWDLGRVYGDDPSHGHFMFTYSIPK